MKKITPISEFKVNTEVQGFYLCKEKHLCTTRAGEPYVDIILMDKTGEISGKIWDRVKEFKEKFATGDPVAVKGKVESFQDKLQLVIGRINKASASRYGRYGFKEELLIPTSPYDSEKMWKELGSHIKIMKNSHLKKLVTDIFRTYKEILLTQPASVSMHYPYRSGHLEHILSMVKLSAQLTKHYEIDHDLLLTGILLHGIGKVKELSENIVPEITDEGNFLGHTVLGQKIVAEFAAKIKNFPQDLLMNVEHMVATHEGGYDRQYRTRPRTKEALLLQQLDALDSKMNLFDQILKSDTEDGQWTSKRNIFNVPLYKKSE